MWFISLFNWPQSRCGRVRGFTWHKNFISVGTASTHCIPDSALQMWLDDSSHHSRPLAKQAEADWSCILATPVQFILEFVNFIFHEHHYPNIDITWSSSWWLPGAALQAASRPISSTGQDGLLCIGFLAWRMHPEYHFFCLIDTGFACCLMWSNWWFSIIMHFVASLFF